MAFEILTGNVVDADPADKKSQARMCMALNIIPTVYLRQLF